MSGFEITDKDVQAIVNWLKQADPKNADEEHARDFLLFLKLSYRDVGFDDPDKIEDLYDKFVKS